jgi:hypothetical protein
VQFITPGRSIPLKKGIHFGFHYSIVGEPSGAPVDLRMVILYPSSGLHNPDVPQPIYRSEHTITRHIGDTNLYRGSGVDYDWGMVPGDWTLEIWYGEQKLTSETFTLVK